MKVFIGWDPRDDNAFRVCVNSLLSHTETEIEIHKLVDWELRHEGVFWRPYTVDEVGQMWDARDGRPFSTQFSFTRFLVPKLCDFADEWVLFMDPDMLVQADIGQLMEFASKDRGVYCVKHNHMPSEMLKMGGLSQQHYQRKNWSSLMLMNPKYCEGLTPYATNNMTGAWLHGFHWIHDDLIGDLPIEWNWLEGWSPPDVTPKIIHYTRGTPDLPGCENVAHAKEWWAEYERTRK